MWRMFAGSVKAKRRKARATCVNGRLLSRGSVQQNRWLIYRVPVGRALLFAGRCSWLGQVLHLEVSLDVINFPFTPGYRKFSIYKREDQWWSTTQPAEGVDVCLTCCECTTERHSFVFRGSRRKPRTDVGIVKTRSWSHLPLSPTLSVVNQQKCSPAVIVMLSQCLIERRGMKAYWGGGITPHILNLMKANGQFHILGRFAP